MNDNASSIERGSSGALPVPALPNRVLLDLRSDCNLKCPMCIVHRRTDDPRLNAILHRSMSLENARRVVDQLMDAKPLLMPTLWSEPLLVRGFPEYIQMMKERGLTLAINTNGLKLNEATAQFMVDVKFDAVCISIDAVTRETLKLVRGIDKLDKIHRAVNLMLEKRGDSLHPRIGVSFTLQAANCHERDAFVDYWAHRVDFVRVGELYDDGRFPGIKETTRRVPCTALYTTMAIQTNGNVSVCCLDGFGETKMGNVFEESVKGVWHGSKLTEIRYLHESGQFHEVPICKNCARWASYAFEEEVKDGLLIRRSIEYTYYNRLSRLENWRDSLLGTHSDPRNSLEGKALS